MIVHIFFFFCRSLFKIYTCVCTYISFACVIELLSSINRRKKKSDQHMHHENVYALEALICTTIN